MYVSEQTLKKVVGDEAIYGMYLGNISTGKKISSPLPGRRDTDPSFVLRYMPNGEVLWIDFGKDGRRGGDSISFVSELFQIPRKVAISKIWGDFKNNRAITPVIQLNKSKVSEYGCKYGEIRDFELPFWSEKLLLTREDLGFWDVHSNRGFWINDKCIIYSTEQHPSYVYIYSDESYKIYTPASKMKFFSTNISAVVEGFNQLTGGGVDTELWMASGLKDAMALWKMGRLFGRKMVVIAPISESAKSGVLGKLSHLTGRYPKRYVCLDFDKAGYEAMGYWKEHFTPVMFELQQRNGQFIKDVTQVVETQGYYTLFDKIRNYEKVYL